MVTLSLPRDKNQAGQAPLIKDPPPTRKTFMSFLLESQSQQEPREAMSVWQIAIIGIQDKKALLRCLTLVLLLVLLCLKKIKQFSYEIRYIHFQIKVENLGNAATKKQFQVLLLTFGQKTLNFYQISKQPLLTSGGAYASPLSCVACLVKLTY